MFEAFQNLPESLMFLIASAVCSVFSITVLILIRKFVPFETFKENHEVGGFLFNALGLIYAVLLAFVVYATWEDYNAAVAYCDNEANTIQDLYLNSMGLPQQYQLPIREKIMEYLDEVIKHDWSLLGEGKQNPNSKTILTGLWKIYMTMDTLKDDKQKIIYSESIAKLNTITDARRQRILSAENSIPSIIWMVIVLGALTSVGFSLFFGIKSLKVQVLMTSLFILTNVMILLLILNLDNPFNGENKITPEDYEYVYHFVKDSVFTIGK